MTSHAVLIQDGCNIPCESGNRRHTFLSQACSSPQSRCQYPTERKTRPAVLPGLILPHGSKHGQIPTGGRNRTVTPELLACLGGIIFVADLELVGVGMVRKHLR